MRRLSRAAARRPRHLAPAPHLRGAECLRRNPAPSPARGTAAERAPARSRRAQRLPLLATNGVLYADPAHRAVLDVFTCVRHHTHLDAAGRLLAPNDERHLKSARRDGARCFADLPEAIDEHRATRRAARVHAGESRLRISAITPCRTASNDGLLSARGDARRRARALRRTLKPEGARADSSTSSRSSRSSDSPAISSSSGIIVNFCRDAGHPRAGPRQRGQQRGLLLPRHHRGAIRSRYNLLFERFSARAARRWPDIDLDLPSGDGASA